MHMHMPVHIYRRNTCQEPNYILQLRLEFCIVSDEAISYTRLHKNVSWFYIVAFGEMTAERHSEVCSAVVQD